MIYCKEFFRSTQSVRVTMRRVFDGYFFSKRKCYRMLRVFGIALLIFLLSPVVSSAYLLKDEERGTTLSIFGLGMVRLNYAFVDGDDIAFESSDDGFAEEFDTQEFLSFAVNGILFHDYALEGELKYNQDDDPDWNFRFKLSRDENYLIFGDQPNIFSEPYFTRFSNPFRGLTLHVESENFGVTTFAAITKGTSEKEEISPDGTSGPYLLKSIPVVPGSDIVTLEVRNRNDQTEVVEVLPQERNVDYTIDYDTGEISFAEAVDTETFRGNPIVIVVTYRSEEESASFRTALTGTRATVSLTQWASVGVTYVSEFDRDPTVSDGFDSRQEVYGIDGTFKLGEATTLTTEYAFSQDHQPDEDGVENVRQAFQTVLDGAVGEKFEFYGKYRLAERDFLTFANSDIDPDEQKLELSGNYAFLQNHLLTVGYSFLQDNLPKDAETPTTTTHRPYIEWEANIREHTEVFSKYEYIQTTDDQSPEETDKQTHIFLVGGVQEFPDVPALKKLVLKGEYQLSDFTDYTDDEEDTLTHQVGLRARTEPAKDVAAWVEQKERLIHDKNLNKNTERQDISEIGLELDRWERFSMQSKYQYRSSHDLLLEKRSSERHTVILSSKYQPFSLLKATGKFELSDEKFFETDDLDESSYQTVNVEGRLLFTPKKDLTARLRYEYERSEDVDDAELETREDETEFRVNYAFDHRKTRLTGVIKIERDLLESPPTPRTKTRTITYFISGARQLTDRWDILAQYKREVVDIAADNVREDILAEIGYSAGRFLKFVGGYQHSDFQDDDNYGSDYTANSIYIKLIGKL
jgi:hypothetical protein